MLNNLITYFESFSKMSNYVGLIIIAQSREDLDKISARAAQLQKDLN